jgi:hypothetical protein
MRALIWIVILCLLLALGSRMGRKSYEKIDKIR